MVLLIVIAQAVVNVGLLSMVLATHYGVGKKVVYARVTRTATN